jgi:hypothetical protein
VKPLRSLWFERKREESTYKAVGSSLIVNKSSVKLWDSRQDSCSFENVN